MLRRRMPGSNRDRSEISAAGRIRNNGIQTAGNGTSQTIEIRNLLNISYELFLDFETSTQGPLCGQLYSCVNERLPSAYLLGRFHSQEQKFPCLKSRKYHSGDDKRKYLMCSMFQFTIGFSECKKCSVKIIRAQSSLALALCCMP